MNLQKLLEGISYVVLQSQVSIDEIEIHSLSCDSKLIEPKDVFVCIEGTRIDGHDYIEDAYEKGASVCVIEKRRKGRRKIKFPEMMIVILVTDTRITYSRLAAAYFGHPANRLSVIGVTGTKGKTTVSYLLTFLLECAGYKVGRIGTMGIQIGEEHYSTNNTTPDAFTIHKYFAKMEEMGCEFAVIEVSSQSLKQNRVEGIVFDAAIFTNFSPDHIGEGEHKNKKEYRYFKSRLFKQAKCAIGNLDDMECSYMFRQTDCRKYGYTCKDIHAASKTSEVLRAEQICFRMDENGPFTKFIVRGEEYIVRIPGMFNVYNFLAALQTMYALGISCEKWKECISSVQIDGRMQRIYNDKNIVCYVDYAHNAMSLTQVLETMRRYHPRRLILVFGCGGNRAKARRSEMGKVAGKLADFTVITSDNPRFEEPTKIVADIVSGIKTTNGRYQIIIDRASAIRYALSKAEADDIVIVAGKGHEDYQEIRGIKYPMSDQKLIEEACMEI